MEYCVSCGSLFDGTEETAQSLRGNPSSSSRSFDWDERGRVSLLLYLGAGLIALSGLLYALAAAALIDRRLPPDYSYYAQAIGVVGFAIVLIGLARQVKRMCE